jgi:hypothetical protein
MEDNAVDRFIDQKNLYRFEGDKGVENLSQIVEALGYKATGFRYGTLIESFLSDNPGAQEALVDWIRETIDHVPEWQENVESYLEEEKG